MTSSQPSAVRAALVEALDGHRPGILSALIRRAGGDFERAEDALAEACRGALIEWERAAVPSNPAGWIVTAAMRRLADETRRGTRQGDAVSALASERRGGPGAQTEEGDMVRDARLDFGSDDDLLRLVFTCCHPSLARITRVALTLNAVSGLDAHAIARAFLVDEAAMSKRLTRAKQKIRDAGIAFTVPRASDVPERLQDVLKTVELIFNEGYAQARGAELGAPGLVREALHLAHALRGLLPRDTEVMGLLALILFTDARRPARVDAQGRLVRLPDQDRSLWDATAIRAARGLLAEAVKAGGAGPFVLRAALSAEHSTAFAAEETRWDRIVGLYDALLEQEPSGVLRLNRAIALGEWKGPQAMLEALNAIDGDGAASLHYLHVARGDGLARLGDLHGARLSFERGLAQAQNQTEREHIAQRLAELGRPSADGGGPPSPPSPAGS